MIPKIIHACWFSGEPLGRSQKICLDSWRKKCPDYEIKIWTLDHWDASKFRFSQEAVEQGQWAFASDVFRLDVLNEHGGVYLDMDVKLIKPLDRFLGHQFFTGATRTDAPGSAAPYIMGAVKGDSFVQDLLHYYKDRPFILPDGTFDRYPNHLIVQDRLTELGIGSLGGIEEEFQTGRFRYPATVLGCRSPQSHAVHLAEYSWGKQPKALNNMTGRTALFNDIYRNSKWGNGSGPGSGEVFTLAYRSFLSSFIRVKGIRSVLDIGCGDWQFSKLIDWSRIDYHGIDVASDVIEANTEKYAKANIKFSHLDAVECDLPDADLVIIKDCLQHLSTENVQIILDKLKRYKNVLVIQDVKGRRVNGDCVDAGYRALDIRRAPFNLNAERVFSFGNNHKEALLLTDACPSFWPELLDVKQDYPTIRYGPGQDGGYVIPFIDFNHVVTIGVGRCVVFERGYANTHPGVSFSLYDHTVQQIPGILPDATLHITGLGRGPNLLPLNDILAQNQKPNTLLKIDCEGGEWEGEFHEADFRDVSAIVIELHWLSRLSQYPKYEKALRSLLDNFVCVHLHPNNFGDEFYLNGVALPDVLETTFLRKDLYHAGRHPNAMRAQNKPNCKTRKELALPTAI